MPIEFVQRNVFSCDLKVSTLAAWRMEYGKAFHNLVAAWANAGLHKT